MPLDPHDELVAVFDAAGAPVGAAPRSRVYAEGLWHASAGVLIRSLDGERVYLHRRTTTKAVYPGMHDVIAGGVVDPGESIEDAARREVHEELGVAVGELTELGRAVWNGTSGTARVRCHLVAYVAFSDGPFVHQPSEIAAGRWITPAELDALLADPAWPFVPDSRTLLTRLRAAGTWPPR